MKQKKLLMLSTHLAGGCFKYSNEIIRFWPGPKDLIMPKKTNEECNIKPDKYFKYAYYPIYQRLLSFVALLLRIICGLLERRYSGLLLFGVSKYDLMILRICSLFKLPSFVVIHDGKMHSGEECSASQNMLLEIMRKSTGLIFLSNYVRDLVKENYGISKPSFIAPHGLIDYGQLPFSNRSVKPTLLFLGRVVRYKGVDMLINAMKNIPENLYDRLIIAGEWSYPVPNDYDSNKIVIVNKWLSNDEILKYISESDIMVFPYLEATQSGVATLAINYQRPSVVTAVGAFKEQFGDNEGVVFSSSNENDLTNAIMEILTKKDLQQMQKSLSLLSDVYQWPEISSKLYKELMESL